MATHSSILAWRIPWTEELGWLLPSRRRVGHALQVPLSMRSECLSHSHCPNLRCVSGMGKARGPDPGSREISLSILQDLSHITAVLCCFLSFQKYALNFSMISCKEKAALSLLHGRKSQSSTLLTHATF